MMEAMALQVTTSVIITVVMHTLGTIVNPDTESEDTQENLMIFLGYLTDNLANSMEVIARETLLQQAINDANAAMSASARFVREYNRHSNDEDLANARERIIDAESIYETSILPSLMGNDRTVVLQKGMDLLQLLAAQSLIISAYYLSQRDTEIDSLNEKINQFKHWVEALKSHMMDAVTARISLAHERRNDGIEFKLLVDGEQRNTLFSGGGRGTNRRLGHVAPESMRPEGVFPRQVEEANAELQESTQAFFAEKIDGAIREWDKFAEGVNNTPESKTL